jgi:hypothetical protein
MKKIFVPFFAAVFLPAAALAQTVDADTAAFATLDANSDHMISMDEAKADQKLAAEFDQVDTNADGSVSQEEYQIAFNSESGTSETSSR